jgi:hypothetical protein
MQRYNPQGTAVLPVNLPAGNDGEILEARSGTVQWTDEVIIDGGSA